MDEPREIGRAAAPDRHLERVEREFGAERGRHPPADDRPAEGVDDEGRVDEARPGGHVGDVGDPEAVRGGGAEHPLDEGGRPRGERRWDGRPLGLATHGADEAETAHQPADLVAADVDALAAEGVPQLARAIDSVVGAVDPADVGPDRAA